MAGSPEALLGTLLGESLDGSGPATRRCRPRAGTPGRDPALMGHELPPDEVLAADQRISWRAGELKKAGLDGDMDVLRARAYLDLLLGKDSRPRDPQATDTTGQDGAPGTGPAPDADLHQPGVPAARVELPFRAQRSV